MDKLISGLAKFQADSFAEHKELFESLATGQNPDVLFITCSDSRIDPNLITQTKPGDLFICRNAGNIVPPHSSNTGGITASIEYAVEVLGVRHVVVCGHSDCGAMKGAMNPDSIKALPHVSNWLGHSSAALARVTARHDGEMCSDHLGEMIEENVSMQLKHLETHPSVAAKMATGSVTLHGWVYDIASGSVRCYDRSSDTFMAVEERYADILQRLDSEA